MRAVVVHPDPAMANLLRFLLQEGGYAPILVSKVDEVLPAVVDKPTNIVLLAVEVPGMAGVKLCQDLRAQHFTGPIIALTQHRPTAVTLQAFAAGVDDVILLPVDPAELLARIEAVRRRCQRGISQVPEQVVTVGEAELSLRALTFRLPDRAPVLLSPTELRVLEHLMRHPGIALSRDTLIKRIWGYELIGQSNRLEVYIRRLRQKLEPDPEQPELIQTVRGIGYVFRPPARPPVRASRP